MLYKRILVGYIQMCMKFHTFLVGIIFMATSNAMLVSFKTIGDKIKLLILNEL